MITEQLGLDSKTDTLRTRPHPSKTQCVNDFIKDDKPAEHLTLKGQRDWNFPRFSHAALRKLLQLQQQDTRVLLEWQECYF